MSNRTRKIKREQIDLEILYNSILSTPYGSFVQTVCILHPEYAMDKFAFVRKFRKVRLPYLNDPDFFVKLCDCFNFDYENVVKKLPIAFVSNEHNSLYMPYLIEENGEMFVLPIRKDGTYPNTYYNADVITPVIWDTNIIEDDKDRKEMEQEMR